VNGTEVDITVAAVGDPNPPSLPLFVDPGPVAQYHLLAPSLVAPGQNFALTVTPEDQFGNPTLNGLVPVSFTSSDPRAVLPGTFDFGFATGLSYKDVRLCIDEAEAMGVPMVAGAAVRQMLAITNAKFGPASDFTSIARVVEEWAGVEIKS